MTQIDPSSLQPLGHSAKAVGEFSPLFDVLRIDNFLPYVSRYEKDKEISVSYDPFRPRAKIVIVQPMCTEDYRSLTQYVGLNIVICSDRKHKH